MKVVVFLGLISMMVAYSLAQMPGQTMPQQQRSQPNFLQMMLMRNMLDLNWPMMYYMSAMNSSPMGMGGMGGNSLYPLLFLAN